MPAARWTLALSTVIVPLTGGHPTHDSLSELTYDAANRTVAIHVRAFADDLGAAIAAMPSASHSLPTDSAMAQYVRATILLIDAGRRLVPLRWEGVERRDDAVIIRLGASVPDGLHGWRLSHALLCERYTDQVNVVRTVFGERSASLLFTRGDAPKLLP